jgi:hypothetical protein
MEAMKTIATGCVRCGVLTPALGGLCEDCETALTPRRQVVSTRRVRVGKEQGTRKLVA